MLISRALAQGSKTVQAPAHTPTLLLLCCSPIGCQVFWTTPRGLSGRIPHMCQGNPPPPRPRSRPIVNGQSHTSLGTRWSVGGERPGQGEGPHRGTVITPPARTDDTTRRSCQAAAHPLQAGPQASPPPRAALSQGGACVPLTAQGSGGGGGSSLEGVRAPQGGRWGQEYTTGRQHKRPARALALAGPAAVGVQASSCCAPREICR